MMSMADGQQLSKLHTIVSELIAAVAWREGIVTQVFEEFGPAAGSAERTRRMFHDLVYSAIDELRTEYGDTADPHAARAFGLDPEAVLGVPALANGPSTIVAFAVWRRKDLWLFLAGRFSGGPDTAHYVILLGATSQNASVAMSRTA